MAYHSVVWKLPLQVVEPVVDVLGRDTVFPATGLVLQSTGSSFVVAIRDQLGPNSQVHSAQICIFEAAERCLSVARSESH